MISVYYLRCKLCYDGLCASQSKAIGNSIKHSLRVHYWKTLPKLSHQLHLQRVLPKSFTTALIPFPLVILLQESSCVRSSETEWKTERD